MLRGAIMTRPTSSTIGLLVSIIALALTVSPSAVPASGAAAREALCPTRITVAELAGLFDAHDVVVIDVRDPVAYWQAHLPGALSIPADLVESAGAAFATSDVSVVVYGDDPSGEASLRAASALRRRGVAQAQALNGGLQEWVAAGRVVVTLPSEPL